MDWLHFMMGALAVWRVSHLIAYEDGPWAVLVSLRRTLGRGFLGELMDCFYCLSIWVGVGCAFTLVSGISEALLCGFAFSGAACLLERWAPRMPVISTLKKTQESRT